MENYLKYQALNDEKSGIARTYLVKTIDNKEIVAYFTLRTGLITISRGFLKGFDATTGIELANFAVNDAFRETNECVPSLGTYVFNQFILPLVKEISNYVGASMLYIFSLPEDKLMSHYETMGFAKPSVRIEKYIYRHVKPAYDKSCRFMARTINN